jgi:hypothetical protein
VLVGWKHHVVSLALALFLKWLGLLYFLQAFSSTGPLVRMVFQIIMDMRYFMVILLVAVLASASSFYSLLHHTRPLHSDDDAAVVVDGGGSGGGGGLSFVEPLTRLREAMSGALERAGEAELIARPRVTTQDNTPALIQSGVRIPYQAQAGGTAGGSITQFVE